MVKVKDQDQVLFRSGTWFETVRTEFRGDVSGGYMRNCGGYYPSPNLDLVQV